MTNDFQQGLVSKTIWPWTESKRKGKTHQSSKLSDAVSLIVGLTIGAGLYYLNHTIMAVVAWSVALAFFACSLLAPKLYDNIKMFLAKFSVFFGQIINWLLLMPFYLLWFSLGHLFHRLRGKDPMTRKFDTESESYWQDKVVENDLSRYRRQF